VPGLLPKNLGLALLAAWSLNAAPGLQAQQPRPDAGGYPAPTPELERGRTVYVLSACHFCHGVDLTRAVMGASDLMHSPIVALDEDGTVIGPIVRAGKPNLQTAMPRYQDLTEEEIKDLARYIHYLRQVGRYQELTSAPDGEPGNARDGAAYFKTNCAGCHGQTGELAGLSAKYTPSVLRARLLRPGPDHTPPAGTDAVAEGRRQHLKLLERYQDADVRNLLAFLRERS
jgi:mono/diheme cytochrome c family protein